MARHLKEPGTAASQGSRAGGGWTVWPRCTSIVRSSRVQHLPIPWVVAEVTNSLLSNPHHTFGVYEAHAIL
jgi:hypothetical protein